MTHHLECGIKPKHSKVGMKKLNQIRRKIDAIDSRVLRLLNQRARYAIEIGHLKKTRGDGIYGIYVPHREETILRRLARENRGPLTEHVLRAVFREIMSGCRRLESELRVAYFRGTNASLKRLATVGFGSSTRCEPYPSIAEVFGAVESGAAQIGIVPVENSDEGSVSDTLDLFINSDLRVCSEWIGVTTYTLCARMPLQQVRTVWGKPDAVAATREWIRRSLPRAVCRKADTFADALGHARKAEGAALVADIQERIPIELGLRSAAFHESQTRYWVLGRSTTLPTGHDKTSLMFTLPNVVGALQEAIQAISETGINITRIESRPSHERSNEFNFFLDIAGHILEPRVKKAVGRLRKHAVSVKVLGAYPVVDGAAQ